MYGYVEELTMKVLVIGGVAAGTKAAAKLLREDRSAEVAILTKSRDISYAGCGLPYYVGDLIHERDQLIVNTPESFERLTGAKVEIGMEVTGVDRKKKQVTVKNLESGEVSVREYDKLVVASGASPIKPLVQGVDLKNVFFMRTPEDAYALRETVEAGGIKRAVIVGGGFIGLEVAENLLSKGVRVSVIDMADHVLPGFDPEMAEYVENRLADEGLMTFTNTKLEGIEGTEKVEKVLTGRRGMKADAVILSIGIRANTAFLADSGIELMPNRTIKVDEYFRTNDPDIYAVGDCACVTNRITGEPQWSPMGSSANIEGRILAYNLTGSMVSYPGVLGTGVCKLPGMNVGRTGLSEQQAKAAGYEVETVVSVVDDKAHYYPGAGSFIVKAVAEKDSGRFLGLQVIGGAKSAVDKMVDIAVMALSMKASVADLEHLDFAYAPPFSTAIHPFSHTINILKNKINGEFETFTPEEYAKGAAKEYRLIDVSIKPSIEGAKYLDLTKIDGEVPGMGKDEKLLLVCAKGKRAYLTQNRLKFYGYTGTKVLEGGTTFSEVELSEK